ncbi:WPP domain-interacting tail-anchored protein 1 [Arachis ipaensis]|uniref:WPP domain-interacting tail-anchored protein 1 n=1 Tax=Arachis ipaensis TaxID=130454 RepID=UPI0007AF2BDA|nr:WPP domain-interacting tail-anchored protein 1 [Arachis ipaensis]XP_025650146.1 WPP domain-interacting tail-anchored protein 1 [Arachis hypogaea]XP_025650147.1 WPP domain-interacting tail-anchored protein 1 [Arachis hypogaea]QHO09430.1 WPP domain-interacting tail-anchored protein [Arachis hypogaea]QHO09431.1 WPP domain-interacting tail-anchored protein [Arachis hypogaea]
MDTQSGEDDYDLHFAVSTMLMRLELNLACFSEKVTNLGIFVMNLETLECELETMILEKNGIDGMVMDMECAEKGLEFDLLCGVLDSEVRELGVFLGTLHAEIVEAEQFVSSSSSIWRNRLEVSEEGFKQSEEQFSEIKKQSTNFQRTLSSYKREESGNAEEGVKIPEDDHSSDVKTGINMQTIEQQRHILRMLEKSLASEMDLEKNINKSRQIEETLKLRIASLEQELIHAEEEAADVCERWFEADNAREILMGISVDLLGKLQISQFNLNGLNQRESELRAKLESGNSDKVSSLEKQLKEYESQLLNTKASADEYQKQYTAMCSEIRDMENLVFELKEKLSNAESRAKAAESEHMLSSENNSELNQNLALPKDGGCTSENVEPLEKQLKEYDLRLQQAVASVEASQEKQSMLCSTIKDMELVIEDLKLKVSKAEIRADSAEDKCIIISETNAELNEELSFLRNRLECLEGSLHLVEEAKVATAKDIRKRTMIFQNLITQIALERERLNKQLSSLASENKFLAVKLKQAANGIFPESNASSANDYEADRCWMNFSANDNKTKVGDSLPDAGSVRRIDAGVLGFKFLFKSFLVVLVSAVAFQFFKDVNVDFGL